MKCISFLMLVVLATRRLTTWFLSPRNFSNLGRTSILLFTSPCSRTTLTNVCRSSTRRRSERHARSSARSTGIRLRYVQLAMSMVILTCGRLGILRSRRASGTCLIEGQRCFLSTSCPFAKVLILGPFLGCGDVTADIGVTWYRSAECVSTMLTRSEMPLHNKTRFNCPVFSSTYRRRHDSFLRGSTCR